MNRWIVVLMVVSLHAVCFAEPMTHDMAASADAFVRSMDPTHNYGGAGGLAASGSAAVNGQGEQMGLLNSFVRFDTASLVAAMDANFGTHDWFVTDAVLTLTEQGAPNHPIFNRGVGLFEVRWIACDAWLEGTGNPRQPTTDGVVYQDEPAILNAATDLTVGTFVNTGADGAVCFELDLPSAFVEDIRAGGPVSLFLTAADDSVGFTFNSRKVAAPELSITADVPEPASIVLLWLGVCLAAGSRRTPRSSGA